jgi:hypothetical protein
MSQGYASYTDYTLQKASDVYIADSTIDDWSYRTTQKDAILCFDLVYMHIFSIKYYKFQTSKKLKVFF